MNWSNTYEHAHVVLMFPGVRVAAIFSEDDLWYRAEVMSVNLSPPPSYVTVLYMDYGNSENVPLNK